MFEYVEVRARLCNECSIFRCLLAQCLCWRLNCYAVVQLLLILLQPSEIGNGIWLLSKHHGMYCFHTVLRKCNGASYHV